MFSFRKLQSPLSLEALTLLLRLQAQSSQLRKQLAVVNRANQSALVRFILQVKLSQTSEKVREEELPPSSKNVFSNPKTPGSSYAGPASLGHFALSTSIKYDSQHRGVQASRGKNWHERWAPVGRFGTHNVNAIRVLNQYLFGCAGSTSRSSGLSNRYSD